MPYVFDVYGTLLDVDAAAREAAEGHPALAKSWPQLSMMWRQRQLSYSWLRSLMQRYVPFWQITTEALDVTLDEMGLKDDDLRQSLLNLYLELSAYDEVPDILARLKSQGQPLAVLSNGDPDMIDAALKSAGIDHLLDAILSVDTLQCYKPDPRVYALVTDHFGCSAADVTFFSSNNWDVAGAGSFGFNTVWVNRGGKVWDDLPKPPGQVALSITDAVSDMTP